MCEVDLSLQSKLNKFHTDTNKPENILKVLSAI